MQYLKLSTIFSLLLFCSQISSAQLADSSWIGSWAGQLEIPGSKAISLVFHISKEEEVWKSTMDSPDQLQYGIEIQSTEINEGQIILKMPDFNATLEGVWEDGKIKAQWKQGVSLNIELSKQYNLKAREFPQHPKEPYPYRSEEVRYQNKKAEIELAGSLTMPKELGEEQKIPAILLISGSGAQDRDETIAGHKPFLVISDHFSRRGYAVLRVDDRGVGDSGGNPQTATTEDFVTDVLAGVDFLRDQPNIDPKKIILMGHSEGGLIAFMAAAKAPKKIGIIVSLAGPGVPMKDLLYQQTIDVLEKEGIGEDYAKYLADLNQQIYKYVLEDKKHKMTVKDLADKVMPLYEKIPQEVKDSMGLTKAMISQACITAMTPWFRYVLKLDPEKYIRKIKCPVLALNGGEDIQVAADPNLNAICDCLRKKGRPATCTKIPKLNHLFQNCTTCTIEEYGKLDETFAPEVLKAMEGWLDRQLKKH
jgi:pimeloyl-ACP methyl ester carboxylesterase